MDHYHVTAYRAVATAAAREVRNYRRLMERIQRKAGIELEVISSEEEARLVCSAVHWALGDRDAAAADFRSGRRKPGAEFLRARRAANIASRLPLGTIRLMETYSIDGAIDEDTARRLRHHVLSLLRSAMPSPSESFARDRRGLRRKRRGAVRLAPGPLVGRTPTINVRLLQDQTWRLLGLDVPGRMRVFRVQKDRAEVMGIAAIIITTLAKWLGLRSMLVPGVGVREGLLLDLVAEQYSGGAASEEEKGRADGIAGGRAMVCAAAWITTRNMPSRWRGWRFRFSISCARCTRWAPDMRLVLEIGRAAARRGTFRAPQIAPPPWRIPDPQRRNSGLAGLAARYGGGAGALS